MFLLSRLRRAFAASRASLLTTTLFSFGLFDEIVAGLPVAGLPLIRSQFGLSYAQIGLLFTIGQCSAVLLEPVINLLSERSSKRFWILGGLLCMTVSYLLAGNTVNYIILLLAFVINGPAANAAIGLAQAILIDRYAQESTRTMTRWTLLSSIGDLLAPLSVTMIASLHMGWNALCWLASAIWLGITLVIAPQRFPHPHLREETDNEPRERILASLKEALRDPVLLRWVILSLLPTMVDEVFLSFATLYLRDVIHADVIATGLALTLQMCGAMLGLLMLDRFTLYRHVSPRRLLAIMAFVAFVSMLTFLTAQAFWLSCLALFVVGLSTSGWYPLAKAQAYAQRPGRAGLIRAVISLGAPLEVALPASIGLVAQRFGLRAAIGILALAPALVLLMLIGLRKAPRSGPAGHVAIENHPDWTSRG